MDENAQAGTIIGQVSASDGDAGDAGKVTYSISQQTHNDFSIDALSGEISVLDNSKLDRETREEITLQIIATDGAPREEARSTSVPVGSHYFN